MTNEQMTESERRKMADEAIERTFDIPVMSIPDNWLNEIRKLPLFADPLVDKLYDFVDKLATNPLKEVAEKRIKKAAYDEISHLEELKPYLDWLKDLFPDFPNNPTPQPVPNPNNPTPNDPNNPTPNNPLPDKDKDGIPDDKDSDRDGDGIPNDQDNTPDGPPLNPDDGHPFDPTPFDPPRRDPLVLDLNRDGITSILQTQFVYKYKELAA